MQTFKISTDKSIKLNGIKFKPYTVGNLPPSFGFKYDEDKDKDNRKFSAVPLSNCHSEYCQVYIFIIEC